ncbi:synaptotagmin-like protein 2 isoform X9 [Scleropages formosus]|nr:synaptotagmin-like protein 2 isoform X9 [Scleropages formosus]
MNEKGDGENSDPGKTTLKQIPSRPMSTSKSLEDIKSLLTLSTAPATPSSSFSDPDQMKRMSMSVPVFVQEENGGRDSDSESSGRSDGQRRTGSSFTNLSASSGVPSVSSQVSGSVMSIYSGDFGSVDVKGTIQFAISYVQKLSEMHIFVVQCRNLAIADIRKNRSDPYVKCYLFPDKAKLGKRKTSVKKKTVNPTYNEILRYRVDIETLRTQTMNLSVWHNDTFGRNSFMGEVDMDLSKWDFSNTQMRDYTLKPRTASGMQPVDYRGEMRVALRFLNQVSQSKQSSKTGEVQIWVKDCKNLPMIRGAAIDPFVKCTVLPDPNKKSRQKTRVLKRTADPQFNHTMVHEGFGPEDLKEACVELTVWDHDRLSNHFIGGLRLGLGTGKSYGAPVDWMDCSSDEAALWERMMDCHNEWVEDVLPLRMLVMARSMSK